ncbi:polysaccharide pyruvyl transferase family protein [Bacteroides pyogenes]|uniref:polysaccharide pyruvyl transferase family protein n=1 Tax=Bacteroides pyogenes TaxID=310300 RepID=UPI001BAB3302|nr:polysaccharide pyruvyl transferase family protein [Bacteroides pyogenes]MBR8704741.1 hypothetical protein [Bacteroides pyogenes]
MRIGILTYHFSQNYGAVLQCFALQTVLEELGFDVRVINYVSLSQKDNVSLYRRNNNVNSIIKNIVLTPFHRSRLKKCLMFALFQKKHLRLTHRVKNQTELSNLVRNEGITHIIVGSDQVWNPCIKEFDRAFFLSDIIGVKKIGYSVSLGSASKKDLNRYVEHALQFDSVTCREYYAANLIAEITGKDVQISPDPTFLLSRNYWETFAKKCSYITKEKRYLLCYFLNKEKYKKNIEFSKKVARERGLEFKLIDPRVSIMSVMNNGIIGAGPSEFINLLYNSDFIITDSFHGTVFSILLNRPFLSINNNPKSNDTRRSDLLKRYCLNEKYIVISETDITDEALYITEYSQANEVLANDVTCCRNQLVNLIERL